MFAVSTLVFLSVNLAAAPSAVISLGVVAAPKRAAPAKLDGVGPLPKNVKIGWSHAPYEVGDCSFCHKSGNPKSPGGIKQEVNSLCFSCHEDLKDIMGKREFTHMAAEDQCTNCHNPHNARYRMLLRGDTTTLCYECHDEIKTLATESKVKHDAVSKERACLNCHNPHATNVEHLLLELPYDLCVNCHGKDGMKDSDGKTMPNIKKLLDENKVWHQPVKNKDCSACHQPHGSGEFRLLRLAYPEKFYAEYDPKNYALCFKCHNEKLVTEPSTATLTKFRDGKTNLHYKHVHKLERGRTCRACHEVHAAKKPHQIREGVPYGSSGWVLPIAYEQHRTGGQCSKTCHNTRVYNNAKR